MFCHRVNSFNKGDFKGFEGKGGEYSIIIEYSNAGVDYFISQGSTERSKRNQKKRDELVDRRHKKIKALELARTAEVEELLIANRFMTEDRQFTRLAIEESQTHIVKDWLHPDWTEMKTGRVTILARRLTGPQGENSKNWHLTAENKVEDWQPRILPPIKDNEGENHPNLVDDPRTPNYVYGYHPVKRPPDPEYHNFFRFNGIGGLQVKFYYNPVINKAAIVEQARTGWLRFYDVEKKK